MFTVVPPTVTAEVDIIREVGLDTHDRVERDGYRSNSEKIAEFLATGNMANLSRVSDFDAELPAEESDFEADSEDFRQELTKDAENFDEVPLLQHFDKIDACEILDEADKKMENSERAQAKNKKASVSKEDSIIKAIVDGFDRVEKKNKAEGQPKE